MQWQPVIGIEVHVQLDTDSKIFSGASTSYGATANTQACAVDLGLPGVLPVLNTKAVEYAIRFGLSIDAEITKHSIFARKNYFYPDLPKGYQISQYESPIVEGGHLNIQLDDDSEKRINLTRAHLEEDAGKSIHEGLFGATGIDLNRAGTPLLEIVSEPEMHSAKQAVAYLKTLHQLVRYLGISDGNMQEGSFRCDVNVSVKPKDSDTLGTRAELKNLNSFRFVEAAINYEIDRQIDILENGGDVIQETRLYDANKDVTRSMRSKEEAHDYRYFPDPDLLPIMIEQETIESIRSSLPELPQQKCKRFQEQYGLSEYDANYLCDDIDTATFFENTLKTCGEQHAKLAANWIAGEFSAMLNKADLEIGDAPVNAEALAGLLTRIADKTISNTIAKQVLESMWQGEGSADEIIETKGLKQITDTGAIEKIIDEVIANNPDQVAQFRAGKEKVFGFFVGQVMKATKGKANPSQVNEILRNKLS